MAETSIPDDDIARERREKLRRYKQQWAKNNRDKILAQRRENYKTNPDAYKARSDKWLAKPGSKEKRAAAASRRWYNSEEMRKKGREYQRRRYWADPEKAAATRLAWNIANRDKQRSANRKHRTENIEKIRARVRVAYKKDPTAKHASVAKYRDANRDKVRAWKRASEAARRSRRNGCDGHFTPSDVREVKRMQRGKCAYCRATLGKKWHIDHIVALAKGGGNERTNIQITCVTCNLRKNSKDPIVFAQEMGLLI